MNYANIKPSSDLSYNSLSTLPLKIEIGWCCAEMANCRKRLFLTFMKKNTKKNFKDINYRKFHGGSESNNQIDI